MPFDRLNGRGPEAADRLRTGVVLVVTWIVCLSLCAIGISDRLADPFAVHNDLVISVYWMHLYNDPGLFPDDLMAEFSSSRTSPAIELIYRIGSIFIDPVTLSRLFPLGVVFLLTPIGFFLGRRLAGDAGGALAAHTLVLTTWYFGPGPGTSGELAILVNTGLALALARKNAPLAGALIVLAALAYPPSALVGGLAFGLWIVTDRNASGHSRLRRAFFFIGSGAAAGAILMARLRSGISSFGPMVTGEEMATMEEFGPDGRLYDYLHVRLFA